MARAGGRPHRHPALRWAGAGTARRHSVHRSAHGARQRPPTRANPAGESVRAPHGRSAGRTPRRRDRSPRLARWEADCDRVRAGRRREHAHPRHPPDDCRPAALARAEAKRSGSARRSSSRLSSSSTERCFFTEAGSKKRASLQLVRGAAGAPRARSRRRRAARDDARRVSRGA